MFEPASDSLEAEAERSLRWGERSRLFSKSMDRALERTDQFYREAQTHANTLKKYKYDMSMILYVARDPVQIETVRLIVRGDSSDYEEALLRLALEHARQALQERMPTVAEKQLHEQMLAWFSCRAESFLVWEREHTETTFRAPEEEAFDTSRE